MYRLLASAQCFAIALIRTVEPWRLPVLHPDKGVASARIHQRKLFCANIRCICVLDIGQEGCTATAVGNRDHRHMLLDQLVRLDVEGQAFFRRSARGAILQGFPDIGKAFAKAL